MVEADSKACSICGKALNLEDCKVDERGVAVHENCYVAKISIDQSKATWTPPPKKPPMHGPRA